MKLIVLILANDTDAYLKMQEKWKLYMNSYANIKSYFIKYDSNLKENIVLIGDTICVKGVETFIPGCLDKTIKSIEYCLQNFEFDFIFRTNMSSVLDLNKLYNLLNNNIQCAGVIGDCKGQKFVSGAGILMRKDICQKLIQTKNSLNYNILDDVSIGRFLTSNNINLIPLTRFEAYNYENNISMLKKENINNYYHFRCKCENNSNKTIELMDLIIKYIYFN
jgi:hypothetical protein